MSNFHVSLLSIHNLSLNIHNLSQSPVFKNASAFLLRDARHAMHDILLLLISAIVFLLTHFFQFSWYHTYGAIFQHYFSSKRLSGSALILCHIIFSSGVSCSFITIGKGSSVCTFQNNVSFREQFPQVLGPNSPNSPKCGG